MQQSPRDARLCLHNKAISFRKLKPAEKILKGQKINATKFLRLVVPNVFQPKIPACLCKEPRYL